MIKNFIALFTLFVFSSISGFAANYRVITELNDFGGITSEYSYRNGDEFYNKYGVERSISFYDYAKSLKKVEFYYIPAASKENGYNKRIEYYNDKEKIVSNEVFHTEEFARRENYIRHTEYYNPRGEKERMDYFYTRDFADKKGYERATLIVAGGFTKEWDYYFTESYIEQSGIAVRKDYYVTDPYGKEKIKETVLFDKDNNEIKKKGE